MRYLRELLIITGATMTTAGITGLITYSINNKNKKIINDLIQDLEDIKKSCSDDREFIEKFKDDLKLTAETFEALGLAKEAIDKEFEKLKLEKTKSLNEYKNKLDKISYDKLKEKLKEVSGNVLDDKLSEFKKAIADEVHLTTIDFSNRITEESMKHVEDLNQHLNSQKEKVLEEIKNEEEKITKVENELAVDLEDVEKRPKKKSKKEKDKEEKKDKKNKKK